MSIVLASNFQASQKIHGVLYKTIGEMAEKAKNLEIGHVTINCGLWTVPSYNLGVDIRAPQILAHFVMVGMYPNFIGKSQFYTVPSEDGFEVRQQVSLIGWREADDRCTFDMLHGSQLEPGEDELDIDVTLLGEPTGLCEALTLMWTRPVTGMRDQVWGGREADRCTGEYEILQIESQCRLGETVFAHGAGHEILNAALRSAHDDFITNHPVHGLRSIESVTKRWHHDLPTNGHIPVIRNA